MLPYWLIEHAIAVHSVSLLLATCMLVVMPLVDCFLIEPDFYHPFYSPMVVKALAWRVLHSTLMSPASIMSFACGIYGVSPLFFFLYIKGIDFFRMKGVYSPSHTMLAKLLMITALQGISIPFLKNSSIYIHQKNRK